MSSASHPASDPDAPPPRRDIDDPSARRIAAQTLAGVVALFGGVVAGALWMRPELSALGVWFVQRFGIAGAAVGTLLADSTGFPIPPDAYLVAVVMGGAHAITAVTAIAAASVLGGNVAYLIGRYLNRWRWLRRRLDVFRRKGEPLFRRWGRTAVTIAAWTPVPFSVVCTLAGAFHMPYTRFALTTLHRVPRMIVYCALIMMGWNLGD
jgi:membrane protein YqaA with SNARE-associated domain